MGSNPIVGGVKYSVVPFALVTVAETVVVIVKVSVVDSMCRQNGKLYTFLSELLCGDKTRKQFGLPLQKPL